MEVIERQEPPVEQPPATYDIVGLTREEIIAMKILFGKIHWSRASLPLNEIDDFGPIGTSIARLAYFLSQKLPNLQSVNLTATPRVSNGLISFHGPHSPGYRE